MKKFAKMSLVAAIAVAGMTTANAGSLADAIKNTDVSGNLYIETLSTNKNIKGGKDATTNLTDINAEISVKSKVNDYITSVIKIESDRDYKENVGTTNENVTMEEIYFAYTNGPLATKFGLQALATPNTDGERAIGVSAAYDLGAVTLAGAYFYDNNLDVTTDDGLHVGNVTDKDISAIALLGSLGPVNAEAWYVYISDAATNVTVAANTTFADVTLGARYATTEYDGNKYGDGSTLRVDLGYSIAGFGLKAMYITTDKDGAALASDTGAANTYELTQFDLLDFGQAYEQTDLDVYALGVNYNMDTMTYYVDYVNAENGVSKAEKDELSLRAKYQMSSNFHIMATYSMMDNEFSDGGATSDYEEDSARLEAKYSF
jgi:predicted porin